MKNLLLSTIFILSSLQLMSCARVEQIASTIDGADPFLYPVIEGDDLVQLRKQLEDIKTNAHAIRVTEIEDPNDARRAPQHHVHLVMREDKWDALINKWLAVKEWKNRIDNPDNKLFVSIPTYWVKIDFIDKKQRCILSVDMNHLKSYLYQEKGMEEMSCIYDDVMEILLLDFWRLRGVKQH